MSLATCPHCGTIFATKDGGCPTCTYRLPQEMLPQSRLHPGKEAVDRTARWFRRIAWQLHEALPHRHQDSE